MTDTVCGSCSRSIWVHFMLNRHGWLFCDDAGQQVAGVPLSTVEAVYDTAGKHVPKAMADQLRRTSTR